MQNFKSYVSQQNTRALAIRKMSSGTGRTYERTGETTEWDDILIKKGIRTKEEILLEKGLNPEDFIEKVDDIDRILQEQPLTLEETLEGATLEDLDELDEEDEFSDSRLLDEYRQRRLAELKTAQVQNRFGDLCEISKADWIRDVTDCSQTCWVAVHLYQDSIIECGLVDAAMTALAPRFKYVKFVKIRSTSAVENWPERNLPTIFFYNEGQLKKQLITIKSIGGKTMQPDDLEWYMVENKIITTSELEEDPRSTATGNQEKRSPSKSVFRAMSAAAYDSDDDM